MDQLEPREDATMFDGVSRHWRLLVGFSVVGLVAAAVATVFIKPKWQAETTLLVPPPSFSLVNLTGAASQVSSLSSSLGGPSILRINKMLLESTRALEEVRAKADLPGSVLEQRQRLTLMRDVTTESTSNTISIAIRDGDPAMAQKVARLYVKALRHLSKTLNVQKSTSEAETVGKSLKEKQAELSQAESKLQEFQEKARTVSAISPASKDGASGDSGTSVVTPGDWVSQLRQSEINLGSARYTFQTLLSNASRAVGVAGQMPTAIPFTESLRESVVQKETEVRILSNKLGPDAPDLIKAKRDLVVAEDLLKKEIERYEKSLNLRTADKSLADAAITEAQIQGRVNALRELVAVAPVEARQYMDLVRRVSILSGITMRLESQLSVANIVQQNDPNAWNVVDDAVLSDKPVNKSYFRNGAIGAVLGFMVGLMVGVARSGRSKRRLRD